MEPKQRTAIELGAFVTAGAMIVGVVYQTGQISERVSRDDVEIQKIQEEQRGIGPRLARIEQLVIDMHDQMLPPAKRQTDTKAESEE